MKKKKCSMGGDLITAGLSFIPGGELISPAVSLVESLLKENKKNPQPFTQITQPNNNVFGKLFLGGPIDPPLFKQESTLVKKPIISPTPISSMSLEQLAMSYGRQGRILDHYALDGKSFDIKDPSTKMMKKSKREHMRKLGGFVNDYFNQYNTGSHASGNDLPVGSDGKPNLSSNVTVQNNENSYKGYVFSDVLTNPETGNKFNVDAAKINKDNKSARFYSDEANNLNYKMNRLKLLNDVFRQMESNQKYLGGEIDPPRRVYPNGREYNLISDAPQIDDLLFQNVPLSGNPLNPNDPSKNVVLSDITQTTTQDVLLDNSMGTEINLGKILAETNISPNKSFTGTRKTSKTLPNVSDYGVLNGLGLLSKALALSGSVTDALRPAQTENAILPDYTQTDRYLKEANINYDQARQDALGVSNMASNTNRSLSTNASMLQSREQSRLAQLQDVFSRIGMQEANQQSQLNMAKSQQEMNKAITNRNIQYENQINNLQNQATSRYANRVLFDELDRIGSSFNRTAEIKKVIENQKQLQGFNNSQILFALQNKYPNFKLSPDIEQKFKNNQISIDEIIQYIP